MKKENIGKTKENRREKNAAAAHSVNSRTAYWMKLVVIGILLIVTQLVAYLVVLQKYNITLKSEYEKSLSFNFEQYNGAISANYRGVTENFDLIFENPEQYPEYMRGYVNSNRNLTVEYEGQWKHYNINSGDYENLTTKELTFQTLRYLSGYNIPSDEPTAIVSKQNGEVFRLLFLNKSQFLKNSDRYGFEAFSVIDQNRKVVFGNYSENAAAYQKLILPTDLERGSLTLIGAVADVDGIVSLMPLSVGEGYWLVGFLTNDSLTGAISEVTSDVVLVMCLTLFLSIAFTVAAAIIYTKKQDFIYGFNIASKDFYVVYTDNLGNIKKSNREFKTRFPVKNLFESENLDSKFRQLQMHDNYIVKITDKDLQPVILNFLATKTSRGFKFAGVEGSDVTDYFINQNETPFIDKATSLYNLRKLEMDYNAYEGNGRRVVGVIKLSNLTLFGTLFGRKFFGQVRLVFANRMKKQFQDIAKVYIIASDTFAVYLDKDENIDALLRDMEQDVAQLNLAVKHGENVVKINVKAGFVMVDRQGDSRFEYVQECYQATLERAMKSETDDFYVYHESQKDFYREFFQKDIDLDDLLERKALSLFYQPQLDLNTNKICGFEALLRLKQSEALNLDVYELIRFAEQSGQMVKLGNFIFNEGMKFASELKMPDIEISLNVSPVQLMQAGFTDDFIRLFKSYGLPEHSISLEVTESFMMSDVETSILKFKLLQNAGIDIRLDDFGMGYSSLQYLKLLPVSYIKIDREFIKDIETNEYSQTIVKMILTMCRDLKLKCVAEGVENEMQCRILKEYGCDMIQGYYISKAVSEEEVRGLLYRYNRAVESTPFTDAVTDGKAETSAKQSSTAKTDEKEGGAADGESTVKKREDQSALKTIFAEAEDASHQTEHVLFGSKTESAENSDGEASERKEDEQ